MDRLFDFGDDSDDAPPSPEAAPARVPHRLAASASGHDGNHERAVGEDQLIAAAGLVQPRMIERWDDVEYLRAYTAEVRSSRSTARELERAAMEAFEEARLAEVQRRRIQRKVASTKRQARIAERKAAGGFYVGQLRSPNRATHVEVDDEAWALVKRDALRRSVTVAAAVAVLVANASTDALSATRKRERVSEDGRRARRFARLFLTDTDWSAFRALCDEASVPVARGVGLVVEREARRLAGRR